MTLRVTGRGVATASVAFEEPLGAAGEVVVVADPFDLGFEGVDDQGVDAGAFDPGDGFSIVGEVFVQANGGLLAASGPSGFYEPFTPPRWRGSCVRWAA